MRIILHTHKDIQVKEGRLIERQSASDKERELECSDSKHTLLPCGLTNINMRLNDN